MTRTIEGVQYLHIDNAAAKLETTGLKVLMLIKRHSLAGTELDGEWFVSGDSLECFKTHGEEMKVGMGCKSHCSSGGCGCK